MDAEAPVANGFGTPISQLEMDWVNNGTCQRWGKEGSEYHSLYECIRTRPELPVAIGSEL